MSDQMILIYVLHKMVTKQWLKDRQTKQPFTLEGGLLSKYLD